MFICLAPVWYAQLRLTKYETGAALNVFSTFWGFYELFMLIVRQMPGTKMLRSNLACRMLQLGWGTGGLVLWYIIQMKDIDVSLDTRYYPDMDGPAAGYTLV